MLKNKYTNILSTFSLLLILNCQTSINVKMKKPGAIEFKEDHVISIAKIKGSTTIIRAALIREMKIKARENNLFSFLDESSMGIHFPKKNSIEKEKSSDEDIEKTSEIVELKEGTTYLELNIKDILIERSKAKQEYWENGLRKEKDIATRTGYFEMDVTAFSKDKVLFKNKMIIGKSQLPRDSEKKLVELQATEDAVKSFIAFLSPEWSDVKLQLDTSDSRQKPIIELIKLKQLKNAKNLLISYIASNPNIASGYFNLGVTYDALAQYEKALDYYLKALKLKNNDMYTKQFKQCQTRLKLTKK